MGRIFEVRKHAMFARWNRMAKQFARIGKEITIAVKKGGPDPDSNPALRRCIQNARAVNMPKDKIEAAIKRASGRDAANFEEVMYEGYAPARRRGAGRVRHRQPDPHRRERAQRVQQERRQPRHDRQRVLPVQAHGRVPPRTPRASTRTTSSCT